MTSPGENIPIVPIDPAIMDMVTRIAHEKINGPREDFTRQTLENYEADLPGYVADLSCFGQQSEEEQAARLITLQAQLHYATFAEDHGKEVAARTDQLGPEARIAQHDCIELSRKFMTLSGRIAEEIIAGHAEKVPDDGLVALIQTSGRDAFEIMTRWNTVGNTILRRSRTILQTTADQMRPYLSPQQQREIEKDITDNPVTYANYIPGVRTLVGFIRNPRQDTRHIPKEFRADYPAIYNEWLAVMGLGVNEKVHAATEKIAIRAAFMDIAQKPEQYGINLDAIAETIDFNPEPENTGPSAAEEAQLFQQELTAIIQAYAQKSAVFRPSWNQVQNQRPGIKAFSNELLRFGSQQKDAPPGKRLTRMFHALEQLGGKTDDPTELLEKFKAHLTVERLIADKINMAQEVFARAGMRIDTSDWEPISEDLDFLATHWKDSIKGIAQEHWVQKTGTRTDALAAISHALTQYTSAKKELLHPEYRLAAIARSLGVVALPAETRPQTNTAHPNRELKRLATQKRFKEIREDMSVPEDMRERAAVIEHFLDLAESQRTPGDDDEFGELFLTERSEQHSRRYFGIRFRDEQQKEWAILESLTLEAATFVIPMDLVRSLGSLEDFISGFGKTAQRELGSVYAVHKTGWTAEAHIERITAKLTQQNS